MSALLETMRAITGTLEAEGSADNSVILAWAKEIAQKFPEMASYCALYRHDETPWCGLTMGYVMAHNGIRPIFGSADTDKFLWAQAWKQFGTPRSGPPQQGDVLVFAGHVSMYEGTEGSYYLCRGGNQADSVNVSHYPISSVQAVRVPPIAVAIQASKPVVPTGGKKQAAITATVFGGNDDPNASAYDEHYITDQELGVALPYRFPGPPPRVRVYNGSKSVEAQVVDVGPWNTSDPYWLTNARPQAESGVDKTGRSTNLAGIDLTPAAARAIGLAGKGKVDWEFVSPPADPALDRSDSKKLTILDRVKLGAQAGAAAVATWITTATSTLHMSIGELVISSLLFFLLLSVWWLAHKMDKLIVKDYKEGRWVPSGQPVPARAPRAIPVQQKGPTMNPQLIALLGPLIQQVLGAALQGVTQPAQTTVPVQVTPTSDGGSTVTIPPATAAPSGWDNFIKALLHAVLMAAIAVAAAELPKLLANQQRQ